MRSSAGALKCRLHVLVLKYSRLSSAVHCRSIAWLLVTNVRQLAADSPQSPAQLPPIAGELTFLARAKSVRLSYLRFYLAVHLKPLLVNWPRVAQR